ncbi:MAG: MtrAB system histidine kinase MtrB [Bowdeniella nasicola]|nr:MtrAB system histidine kinase MtrB [Bowdeniella nasicola]
MAGQPARTAGRRWESVRSRWQGSLTLRIVVTIMVAGAAALTGVGAYVATSIRDGMFDNRLESVLSDAMWRADHAQSTVDAANVQSTAQVQRLAYDLIYDLRYSSAGTVGVMLIPATGRPASAGNYVTDRALVTLITPELTEALDGDEGQYWQSVRVPTTTGHAPGVIVGRRLQLPLVGTYNFFTVYSLAAEQQSVNLVMRVLYLGAVALVGLLGAVTWLGAWQVVKPVREAAQSAERIAAGVLDERMMVRGTDELATLGHSFNRMAESLQEQIGRLEELSRVQRRFVSDVSHELRTPLATIRMAAEVIYEVREDLDPVTKRSAELLYGQLDRFESMLADLLEISRFDAGAAVLAADEEDLRPVIERVIDMAQPLAERRGVELRVHGMSHPVTAEFDPRRIERVVRNLVLNAIEHTADAPVDITLGSNARAVSVRVLDHGIGMTRSEAAHVFDRFWRADPARARTTGGAGLGLAISLEDARLHGGTLEAWGEEGIGASFLLTLPRRTGTEPGPAPVEIHPLATVKGAES